MTRPWNIVPDAACKEFPQLKKPQPTTAFALCKTRQAQEKSKQGLGTICKHWKTNAQRTSRLPGSF